VSVRIWTPKWIRAAPGQDVLLDASQSCPNLPEGLAMMIPSQNTLVAFSAPPPVRGRACRGGINAFTAALIRPSKSLDRSRPVYDAGSILHGAPVGDFYFTNPLLSASA